MNVDLNLGTLLSSNIFQWNKIGGSQLIISYVNTEKLKKILLSYPLEILILAVAAIAARIFIPILALPLGVMTTSALAMTLALKLAQKYNVGPIITWQNKIYSYNEKYQKLRLITFAATLALSFVSVYLASIASLAIGAHTGIIFYVKVYTLPQQNQV